MASELSSMPSIERSDSSSVPTGVGATLGQNPCSPPDELSKPIRVALQLEARKLPNLDTRGKSDPFVILYRKADNSTSQLEKWHEIARTETVYNNLNPKWSRTFKLDFRFGTTTTLRFSVYDRDSKDEDLSKHDYIGEVRCTVAQVVLADNQRLVAQINNKNVKPGTRTGTLVIRAEEQQGDLGDNVTLQFAARGLRHGRKPFYVLSNKNRNDEEFSPVIYSEVHRAYAGANHVTTFKPITTSLARLTNGDMSRELEVCFMDYDRFGNHYRGGSVRFTLKAAKAAISSSPPARYTLKKKRSNGHVVEAGGLIVNKCEISVPFSFIDYISSGVEINTVIAIDMSDTNGNPFDPRSLHHNRGENEYMIALREVGNVLAAYDTSQRFHAFGLGAAQAPNFHEAVHCFPLLGSDGQPVCEDINGVIEAYRKALVCTVAPFGPCRYGPLLKHVIDMTRGTNITHDAISYTVLLLFTDGDFADFADVANLICDGAELPLSIVIVGVGNSRFLKLERLDGDDERLCSTEGIPCARDIVQFVQFHKHRHNSNQLAQEVLDEIPEQLVSFMRSKGLKPSDITPLRRGPAQAPPGTEKHPYLPKAVVHAIPHTSSSGPSPEVTCIPDNSIANGHGPSSVPMQHNNPVLANTPTPHATPSYAPVVSAPMTEVPAPGTGFLETPMPPPPLGPPVLQAVPSSGAESVPYTLSFNRPTQPSHEPQPHNIPPQGSSHSHASAAMAMTGAHAVPSSGAESVPYTLPLNRPTQPSHDSQPHNIPPQGSSHSHSSAAMAMTGVQGTATKIQQTHMPSQPGAQTCPSVPPSGAESGRPSSHFTLPVHPPHDTQPPNMPPLGSGHSPSPHFQHPPKPNVYESSTYAFTQGHPPQYPGGYGAHHVHVPNGPYQHHPQQYPTVPSHFQQASPYHNLQGPHPQHNPPHQYGSHPYPYGNHPAQHGGTYNQAPPSDLTQTYSSYPASPGQPYPYPPPMAQVASSELPYHIQHSGPSYPSR